MLVTFNREVALIDVPEVVVGASVVVGSVTVVVGVVVFELGNSDEIGSSK